MISTKWHIGVIDDCSDGTVGAFELPSYMKGEDMIGARVKVNAQDKNGMPITKRGKLIEIFEEWN
jgi:hypothetical protein